MHISTRMSMQSLRLYVSVLNPCLQFEAFYFWAFWGAKPGWPVTVSWMTILEVIPQDGDAKQFYDMLSNYGTKQVSARSFAAGAPKSLGAGMKYFMEWYGMIWNGMDEFDTLCSKLFKDIGCQGMHIFGFLQSVEGWNQEILEKPNGSFKKVTPGEKCQQSMPKLPRVGWFSGGRRGMQGLLVPWFHSD